MPLLFLLQATSGDGAVHVTLGTGIAALLVQTIWREFRDRKANGNGTLNSYEYWKRMREEVTDPIVKALEKLK